MSLESQFILAIDLGTSGPKVALATVGGELLGSEFEETQLLLLPDGGAEQSTDNWWQAIDKAVQRLLERELAPNQEYCFRIRAEKSALCNGGWETAWDGPECATMEQGQGSLSVGSIDTTTIDLGWEDGYQTETGSTIERCLGDLMECCPGGDPAVCDDGNFTEVGTVARDVTAYLDTSACENKTYFDLRTADFSES